MIVALNINLNNSATDTLSQRGQQGRLFALSSPVPQGLESIRDESWNHLKLERLHLLVQEEEPVGHWQLKFKKTKLWDLGN